MFCSLHPHTQDGFTVDGLVFAHLRDIRALTEFMRNISMDDRDVRRDALEILANLPDLLPSAAVLGGVADVPVACLVGKERVVSDELVDALEATPELVVRLGYAMSRLEQIQLAFDAGTDTPALKRFLNDVSERTTLYPKTEEGTASRIAELVLALGNELPLYLPKFTTHAWPIAKLQLYLSVHNHRSMLHMSYHQISDELFASSTVELAAWIMGNAHPALV